MKRNKEGLIPTNWYVITGAPSSGTTTLVNRLAHMGYMTVPETARMVIDEEVSKGKTIDEIRSDEMSFQTAIAEAKAEIYRVLPPEQLTFLTRSLEADTIAFMPWHTSSAKDTGRTLTIVRNHRYKGVFLLDRLPVKNDYARIEDDQRARNIDALLEAALKLFNYNPIRIPVMPVTERAEFVLDHLPKRLRRLKKPGAKLTVSCSI